MYSITPDSLRNTVETHFQSLRTRLRCSGYIKQVLCELQKAAENGSRKHYARVPKPLQIDMEDRIFNYEEKEVLAEELERLLMARGFKSVKLGITYVLVKW